MGNIMDWMMMGMLNVFHVSKDITFEMITSVVHVEQGRFQRLEMRQVVMIVHGNMEQTKNERSV